LEFAVTADLHLRQNEHNERFIALKAIFDEMHKRKISTLVIAGDLFDADEKNYSAFEKICTEDPAKNFKIYIIPGNHDSGLKQKMFASGNISVISTAQIIQFDMMSKPVCFIPYKKNTTVGEQIQNVSDRDMLVPGKWILISHGDWIETINQPNPYEPGLYMPLTRGDLETHKPASVFLGHIHKPIDSPVVHFAGSPCPLDINETGKRRFLLVDSETADSESVAVESPLLYFNEKLLILPVDNEQEYIFNQAEALIKKWAVDKAGAVRIQIRITVKGYTKDKSALDKIVRDAFKDFSFYNNEAPDLSKVFLSDDFEKNEIALKVRAKLIETRINRGETQPSREEVMLSALHIIYGDK